MTGDEWQPQDDLYQALNNEFNFEFDLCANKENTKCLYWTDDIVNYVDSFNVHNYYWMNPPYSRNNIG